MTTTAGAAALRPPADLGVVLAGATAAAVASAGAAVNPRLALVGLGAAGALALAVLRPRMVPALLAVTVVFENVEVGGVASNRAAVLVAVVAIVAGLARRGMIPPADAAPAISLVAFAGLAAASILWTTSDGGTAYLLTSLAMAVVYATAFAVLVRRPRDAVITVAGFVAAASAMAVWWVLSYARGIDRFENPAGDPNRVALYLVMAIPLAISLSRAPRASAARLAVGAVAVLLTAGALATLSRGAVLALAVTAVATVALPAAWTFGTRTHRRRCVAAGLLALVVAGALTGPAIAARFQERPAGTDLVGTRGDLWAAALRAYGDHPVTGLGFGAFPRRAFDLLRSTPGVSLPHHTLEALREGRAVHNVYLEALAELGPAGVVLFVAVLATTARSLIRSARRSRGHPNTGGVAAGLVAALAGFAAASMLLSTSTARVLAMVVGLGVALSSITRAGALEGNARGS